VAQEAAAEIGAMKICADCQRVFDGRRQPEAIKQHVRTLCPECWDKLPHTGPRGPYKNRQPRRSKP